MTRPRISVIVPARDAAATFGATLVALQAQAFVEHEVIARSLRQTGLSPRPEATRWNQMGD